KQITFGRYRWLQANDHGLNLKIYTYVGEFVLDFINLKELMLAVRISKIPDQHQLPSHLAHISLNCCYMREDPMPILEKLIHLKSVELRFGAFVGRRMLKELPDGVKFITSLKELKIERMKQEWKEKLVPGGEDYYKVQHIPEVQFFSCDNE
ncbi:hypothetical protein CARUB_v10005950mg, partial [Capsella rubella]